MRFSESNIILCGSIETVLPDGALQEGGGIGGTGITESSHSGPGYGLQRRLRVVEGGGGKGTLTLVGMPGVTVKVNSWTKFKGVRAPVQLNSLNPGDPVKVLGQPGRNNQAIATEVERTTATTQVVLQGPIASMNNPVVVILGMPVNTTPISENKFRREDGTSLGRQAFFHLLDRGAVVKLEGTYAGDTIVWSKAEVRGKFVELQSGEWNIRETDEQHRDRVALMRVIRYEVVNDLSKNRDRSKGGRALSINISRGGMLMLMDHEPTIDQPLRVFMPTPAGSVNIPTLVDVRWTRKLPLLTGATRDVYFVGLRFVL